MSNANQSDFRAAEARRKERLAKRHFEQVRARYVFKDGAPRVPARSAEYVPGLDPLYQGEVRR